MKPRAILLSVFLLLTGWARSQDTLRVTIEQADAQFLKNNFNLLASSMHIEAQKAQVIQAKVYPNPVFTADLNLYDPDNDQFFHAGKTGEKAFQIDQLIVMGGKRKAEIELAKTNATIAGIEFQQLLQELKFKLHSDLHEAGQQLLLLQRYNNQLNLLSQLVSSYETQVSKGNIPLKDLVRLKGAYLKLNNDRSDLLKTYYETQTELQTLLQTSQVVQLQFKDVDIEKYIKLKNIDDLKAIALQNRPELQLIQQNKIAAEQYLRFQKKLVIPDVNLFASYDQRGGAFSNQINAGIAIPLPIFDRNQGNIKAAEYENQATDYQYKAIQSKLLSELQNNFNLYLQAVTEYQKAMTLYTSDFDFISKSMSENFQKRNVSSMEFFDFFENYNDAISELSRVKTQLVIAAEQLNLLTGKDIY